MKARVITSVAIAAKPADIFKFLADLKYHSLWNPNLRRITPVVPLEKGTLYRTTSLLFGMRVSGQILVRKVEPPKVLELQSVTGMLEYVVNYGLHETKDGTVVRCRTTVSTKSKAFAFAKPMMQLLAQRELQSDLDALKQLVEQGAPVETIRKRV